MASDDRAPIAVFAFRRLDLLQQTLASLERAEGFTESPLYLFLDAGREGQDTEQSDVARLRDWVHRWASGRKAVIAEATSNLGLRKSITKGVSAVLDRHETVIVMEDDIVVSRWFLQFMNDSLTSFKDVRRVLQVSGYWFPHTGPLPPIGLLRVPGSWGWGTWRRAWTLYNDNATELVERIKSDKFAFDISGHYSQFEALQKNAEGTLDTWLIRWYASMFLNDGLTVYPSKSMTRNVGFDSRATNTRMSRIASTFSRQELAKAPIRVPTVDPNDVFSESEEFLEALKAFYRWQLHQWTRPSIGERFRARLELVAQKLGVRSPK